MSVKLQLFKCARCLHVSRGRMTRQRCYKPTAHPSRVCGGVLVPTDEKRSACCNADVLTTEWPHAHVADCQHDWQEQPGEPAIDVCSSCGEVRS